MSDNIFHILDETAELLELNPVAMARPKHKVLTEILSLYTGLIIDSRLKLRVLIEIVIRYCGKSVLIDDVEVILSWVHVQSYLEKYTPLNEHLYSHIVAVFAGKYKRSFIGENSTWKLDFGEDTQSALSFKLFLQHILPFENDDLLKESSGILYLPEDLTFFYSRYFTDEEGKLFPHYLHDTLLKTLRADRYDFSHQFISGIIPGENNQRRLANLRPKNRKPYIVTHDGKVMLRLDKKPMLTPQQKQGYTQAQSCTLIGDIQSPPFGLTTDRNDTLYGLITDIQDAHIQRLLMDDGGTVGRKFEADDYEAAKIKLGTYQSKDRLFFSSREIRTFKKYNSLRDKWNDTTNELLARLRFNPYRSAVCICANSLEARLLAYDFAEELWEHYCVYAKKQGLVVNNNYRLPVIFYFPRQFNHEKRHLRFYTEAMHRDDQKQAYKKFHINNGDSRQALYILRSYEFLLGLKEINLDILREEVEKVPLALHMINNGRIRLLMRLLRPSRCSPNLKREIIEYLLSTNLIKKNDPCISEFILVEEFELADQLIQETGSEKEMLTTEKILLVNHIAEKGNPRQMDYFGLEEMLKLAALHDRCYTIKLCLKEFKVENQALLSKLLCAAARTKEHALARMLLEMGVSIVRNGSESPMSIASDNRDWEMVKLFAQRSTDEDDNAEFDLAALNACKHNNFEIAMMLLNAGAKPFRRKINNKSQTVSTVFYAIINGQTSTELLVQLIDYEFQVRDDDTLKRISFEIIATYEADDSASREFLLERYQSAMQISVESEEWNTLFRESLKIRFEEIVRVHRYEGIWRLFELSPHISEETAKRLFDLVLVKKAVNILNSWMSNSEYSDETKGYFIMEMLGDEFSENEIIAYIKKYSISVKIEHFRRAAIRHFDKLASFLLRNFRLKVDLRSNEFWDLYELFHHCPSPKSVLSKDLLYGLGPRVTREIVLILLVRHFNRSFIWPRSDWKTLQSIQTKLDQFYFEGTPPFSLAKEYHPEIMTELCSYFSYAEIPDEKVGKKTLNNIFDLFEKAVKSTPRFQFGKEKSRDVTFNREVYDCLKVWKKLIFEYEKGLQKKMAESSNIDHTPSPELTV